MGDSIILAKFRCPECAGEFYVREIEMPEIVHCPFQATFQCQTVDLFLEDFIEIGELL